MKPVVLAGFDDERTKIPFTVPVKGKRPQTVKIPRFDFIDEDTFDALTGDLEALDVEQQVIAVANDLAAVPIGEVVSWEPLIDAARKRLTGLGVKVVRVVADKKPQDDVSAPSDAVVAALEPYSSQKPLQLRKRSREICLAMLKHVVTEEQYGWFEALPTGALDELLTAWRKQSAVSLGESEASSST